MRYIGAMLLVFFFISCSTDNGEEIQKENENKESNVFPVEPGTYQGVLPCADCEGILTTIQLESTGIATVSRVYLGKDETPYMEFGLVEFYDTLAVVRGGKELSINLKGYENHVLLLDENGKKIESALNYNLEKTNDEINFSFPFYATGRYFYMADAHVMWLGSIPFPVLQNELNMEAERLFMQVNDDVKDEFYFVAKMRIVEALNMEDNLREHVELLELW